MAIGIATVCLIFSILASHMQEIWASFNARRAASLEIALKQMLSDPNLSEAFFAHPLIQSISFSPTRTLIFRRNAPPAPRPTYISSDLFSKVLQSILASTHKLSSSDLPNLIAALPDSMLKSRIKTLTLGVETDAAACNAAVEKWYDSTMERINGLYKRDTQVVLLSIGLALAVLCNVNLLRITSILWTSAAARDEVNAVAQLYGCKDKTDCSDPDYVKARTDLETNLKLLPIGYKDFHITDLKLERKDLSWHTVGGWAYNLCGWLLTAIAVSLGAPFWFDLINKFINIRMVGQKPATAEKRK
ncbi:MAG: hypothetical protein WBL63_14330 [Candidatus Acidiferrum sp.]